MGSSRAADLTDVEGLQPVCRACFQTARAEELIQRRCFYPDRHPPTRCRARVVYEVNKHMEIVGDDVQGGQPVCTQCFQEFPDRLVRECAPICSKQRSHGPSFRKGFVWLTKGSSRTVVRPTPFNMGRMVAVQASYRLLHSHKDCCARPRRSCTFPHNRVEKQFWNKWKAKGIDEISLTHLARHIIVTVNSRSGQSAAVARNRQPVAEPHSAYGPSCEIPAGNLLLPNGELELRRGNYKTWFRTLLFHEMKHIRERMDGLSRFYPLQRKEYVRHHRYFILVFSLGDGDTEFLVQNALSAEVSNVVPASTLMKYTSGKGLHLQIFPSSQLQSGVIDRLPIGLSVRLVFTPKFDHYWHTLQLAVEDLSAHVISMLLPTGHDFVRSQPRRREISFHCQREAAALSGTVLELDSLYQQDALNAILTCSPGPPFLLTGPFGTGKTRLIARLAHQVITAHRDARVLICVHHLSTANSYLESFFLRVDRIYEPIRLLETTERKPSERAPWSPDLAASDWHYRRVAEIAPGTRLIIATNTAARSLLSMPGCRRGYFNFIFIDEAAQCIEPQIIVPLLLAGPQTQVVLAGDHMQVGAADEVHSREAQEKRLNVSLLARLCSHYDRIEKSSGVKGHPCNVLYRANLLSNYRCAAGILRLPSNLFYESSLFPRVSYDQHPKFNYPFVFICTSMDGKAGVDEFAEVREMMTTLRPVIADWPGQWNDYGRNNAVCLMARSYRQIAMIRQEKRQNLPSHAHGMVTERHTFAIQGSEFTAVILCTAEESAPEAHSGRSLVNPRVFNTIITRSRALFIAIGNPFHLLEREQQHGGERCWREYLKKCIESNSITFPPDLKDGVKEDLFRKVFVKEEPVQHIDNVLESYEEEFRSRLTFLQGFWKLLEAAKEGGVLTSEGPSDPPKSLYTLKYLSFRECQAVPVDGGPKILISGVKARKHALDGAAVEVNTFSPNHVQGNQLQYGSVTRVVKQSSQRQFLCTMDPYNSSLFVPLDGKGPKLANLPPISRRLLEEEKVVESTLNNKKNPVACFDSRGLEKKIPRLKDVVPFEAAKELIFLVRLIEWRERDIYPTAVVIDVFPCAHTIFHTERMLTALYTQSDVTVEPIELVPRQRPPKSKQGLTMANAITISGEDNQVFENALSVVSVPATDQQGSNCRYKFSVHVTDVCSSLSPEDQRAVLGRGRAICLQPNVIHSGIFPTEFIDACSLRSGHAYPCFTLSGCVSLDDNDVQELPLKVEDVYIRHNYTYQGAHRAFIVGDDADLHVIYYVSRVLRSRRLGSTLAHYVDSHPYLKITEIAMGTMVEDFTIWANQRIVGELQRLGCLIPLRVQVAPDADSLEQLRESVAPIEPVFEDFQGNVSVPTVLAHTYTTFRRIDRSAVIYLTRSSESYPQLVVKNCKELAISQPEEYTVVDPAGQELPLHYGLGTLYTHFTSPLRRAIDVMAQVMLASAMQAAPLPLALQEAQTLAKTCTRLDKVYTIWEQKYREAVRAVECFHSSFKSLCVVVSCEGKTISVKIPTGPMSNQALKLSLADLSAKQFTQGRAMWTFKLFSIDPSTPICLDGVENVAEQEVSTIPVVVHKMPLRDPNGIQLQTVTFPPVRSVDPMPADVLEDYFESLYTRQDDIRNHFSRMYSNNLRVSSNPYLFEQCSFVQVEVSKDLKEAELLSLWVGSNKRDPTLSCEIQVVQPVPFLNVCVQHTRYPAQCFSNPILHNASRNRYVSMEQYVGLWEEVQLAEAAEQTPTDNERDHIYLQNATLTWPLFAEVNTATEERHYLPRSDVTFFISKEFLKQTEMFVVPKPGDFICAQYEVPQPRPPSYQPADLNNAIYSAAEAIRAVYHFVVQPPVDEVSRSGIPQGTNRGGRPPEQENEGELVRMIMVGKQNVMVSPKMCQLLRNTSAPLKCTLQLIANSVSTRRLYSALKSLKSLAQFEHIANNIILGTVNLRNLRPLDGVVTAILSDPLVNTLWSSQSRPPRLNPEQQLAISGALRSNFYLIQGPPGTGKSETGAHLAYAFALQNRMAHNGKCVLYCGPSNKSVNVVVDKLHSLLQNTTANLKILRIYNRVGELHGRTGPNDLKELHQPFRTETCPEHLVQYTMHHMVLNSPYGPDILAFEEKFARMAAERKIVGDEMKIEYFGLRSAAELLVLSEKFDVILCTCNEAAGTPVERVDKVHEKVLQCIIDECAMATEVESMAVIRHAGKVVLIGDHKQLQPVIKSRSARSNGLGRSLFEKYANICEKLRMAHNTGCFILLREQYRMHQILCQYPSEKFYDRCLKTASSVIDDYEMFCLEHPEIHNFWPRGAKAPTVFYDVRGGRESHISRIDRARLESKCNEVEARKVIAIARQLVEKYKVKQAKIAVLTPYTAQKTTIAKRIEKIQLLKDIKVSSITESQGSEFPIVILSLVRTMNNGDFNPSLVRKDKSWLLEHLGFVTDPHQICVGITRCKFGLIIVGNSKLLSCDDDTWGPLIDYYKDEGYMR